jgi:predicted permease
LPRQLVGTVARFTFYTLLIPLIYSTIASAVTIESVGNYWFVIVGAFGVLAMSYFVATLMRYCIPIANQRDFCALRIAATFPNIVALPILIFPSLCEFPVVHEGYIPHDEDNVDPQLLERQCVDQANTMIFCYFFSWSLAFWSFGSPQLIQAAKRGTQNTGVTSSDSNDRTTDKKKSDEERGISVTDRTGESSLSALDGSGRANLSKSNQPSDQEGSEEVKEDADGSKERKELQNEDSNQEEEQELPPGVLKSLWQATKQTVTSPGFIAMALGFVTACIPPLQRALFEAGAPLRFLGSAVETLGAASSSISTMVVAASLVPPKQSQEEDSREEEDDTPVIDANPAMTDPNFGPYQRPRHRRSSRFQQFRRSMRSSSFRLIQAMPRSTPEMRRLHIWFCLSRLVVTPAAIVGIILALDCGGGLLSQVPNLAKLVIIINSALPGALIVAVILKSKEEMAETAAAVAKVYLPSYLLSIVTISAWTAVGLWVTLPDEDGNTVCERIYKERY